MSVTGKFSVSILHDIDSVDTSKALGLFNNNIDDRKTFGLIRLRVKDVTQRASKDVRRLMTKTSTTTGH